MALLSVLGRYTMGLKGKKNVAYVEPFVNVYDYWGVAITMDSL